MITGKRVNFLSSLTKPVEGSEWKSGILGSRPVQLPPGQYQETPDAPRTGDLDSLFTSPNIKPKVDLEADFDKFINSKKAGIPVPSTKTGPPSAMLAPARGQTVEQRLGMDSPLGGQPRAKAPEKGAEPVFTPEEEAYLPKMEMIFSKALRNKGFKDAPDLPFSENTDAINRDLLHFRRASYAREEGKTAGEISVSPDFTPDGLIPKIADAAWREVKTIGAGLMAGAADFAAIPGLISDTVVDIIGLTGVDEEKLRGGIFDEMQKNARYYSEKWQREGLQQPFIKDVLFGLGKAGVDLPAIMIMGGLPAHGFLQSAALAPKGEKLKAGIEGAVTGWATKATLGMTHGLPVPKKVLAGAGLGFLTGAPLDELNLQERMTNAAVMGGLAVTGKEIKGLIYKDYALKGQTPHESVALIRDDARYRLNEAQSKKFQELSDLLNQDRPGEIEAEPQKATATVPAAPGKTIRVTPSADGKSVDISFPEAPQAPIEGAKVDAQGQSTIPGFEQPAKPQAPQPDLTLSGEKSTRDKSRMKMGYDYDGPVTELSFPEFMVINGFKDVAPTMDTITKKPDDTQRALDQRLRKATEAFAKRRKNLYGAFTYLEKHGKIQDIPDDPKMAASARARYAKLELERGQQAVRADEGIVKREEALRLKEEEARASAEETRKRLADEEGYNVKVGPRPRLEVPAEEAAAPAEELTKTPFLNWLQKSTDGIAIESLGKGGMRGELYNLRESPQWKFIAKKKGGLSLSKLAEIAGEAGFLGEGDPSKPRSWDEQDVIEAINEELSGKPRYKKGQEFADSAPSREDLRSQHEEYLRGLVEGGIEPNEGEFTAAELRYLENLASWESRAEQYNREKRKDLNVGDEEFVQKSEATVPDWLDADLKEGSKFLGFMGGGEFQKRIDAYKRKQESKREAAKKYEREKYYLQGVGQVEGEPMQRPVATQDRTLDLVAADKIAAANAKARREYFKKGGGLSSDIPARPDKKPVDIQAVKAGMRAPRPKAIEPGDKGRELSPVEIQKLREEGLVPYDEGAASPSRESYATPTLPKITTGSGKTFEIDANLAKRLTKEMNVGDTAVVPKEATKGQEKDITYMKIGPSQFRYVGKKAAPLLNAEALAGYAKKYVKDYGEITQAQKYEGTRKRVAELEAPIDKDAEKGLEPISREDFNEVMEFALDALPKKFSWLKDPTTRRSRSQIGPDILQDAFRRATVIQNGASPFKSKKGVWHFLLKNTGPKWTMDRQDIKKLQDEPTDPLETTGIPGVLSKVGAEKRWGAKSLEFREAAKIYEVNEEISPIRQAALRLHDSIDAMPDSPMKAAAIRVLGGDESKASIARDLGWSPARFGYELNDYIQEAGLKDPIFKKLLKHADLIEDFESPILRTFAPEFIKEQLEQQRFFDDLVTVDVKDVEMPKSGEGSYQKRFDFTTKPEKPTAEGLFEAPAEGQKGLDFAKKAEMAPEGFFAPEPTKKKAEQIKLFGGNDPGKFTGFFYAPSPEIQRMAESIGKNIKAFGRRAFSENRDMPPIVMAFWRRWDNYTASISHLLRVNAKMMDKTFEEYKKNPVMLERLKKVFIGDSSVDINTADIPEDFRAMTKAIHFSMGQATDFIREKNGLTKDWGDYTWDDGRKIYLEHLYRRYEYPRVKGGPIQRILGKNKWAPDEAARGRFKKFLVKAFPEYEKMRMEKGEDALEAVLNDKLDQFAVNRKNPGSFTKTKSLSQSLQAVNWWGSEPLLRRFSYNKDTDSPEAIMAEYATKFKGLSYQKAKEHSDKIIAAKREILAASKRAIWSKNGDAKDVPFEKLVKGERSLAYLRNKLRFSRAYRIAYEDFAGFIGKDNLSFVYTESMLKMAKAQQLTGFFDDVVSIDGKDAVWKPSKAVVDGKEVTLPRPPGWKELKGGEFGMDYGAMTKDGTAYVSPEFYSFLKHDVVPRSSDAVQFVEKLFMTPWRVGHVLGSVGTMATNILGDVWFSYLARTSVFNPMNMPYYAKAVRDVVSKNTLEGSKRWAESVEKGWVNSPYAGADIRRSQQRYLKHLDESMAWSRIANLPGQAVDILAGFQNGADQAVRLAAAYKKTSKSDYAKLAGGGGYTDEQAKEELDRTVPNYLRLPEVARTLRRTQLMGPFASFKVNAAKIMILQYKDGFEKIAKGLGYTDYEEIPGRTLWAGPTVGGGGRKEGFVGEGTEERGSVIRVKNPRMVADGVAQVMRITFAASFPALVKALLAKHDDIPEEVDEVESLSKYASEKDNIHFRDQEGNVQGFSMRRQNPFADSAKVVENGVKILGTLIRGADKEDEGGIMPQEKKRALANLMDELFNVFNVLGTPLVDMAEMIRGKELKTGRDLKVLEAAEQIVTQIPKSMLPQSLPIPNLVNVVVNLLETGQLEWSSGKLTTDQIQAIVDADRGVSSTGTTGKEARIGFFTGVKVAPYDGDKIFSDAMRDIQAEERKENARYKLWIEMNPTPLAIEERKEIARHEKAMDSILTEKYRIESTGAKYGLTFKSR